MKNAIILPPSTIGIIGGGQLGRMIGIAAKQMGYKIAVLEPLNESPCKTIADDYIMAPYNDEMALAALANCSDVITYEFENIPYQSIESFIHHNKNAYLPQGYMPLKISQNRLIEKTTIQQNGYTVAPFYAVNEIADLDKAAQLLGFPFLLKTITSGYDGKGQLLIKTSAEYEEASNLIKQQPCIAEKKINFDKEVSVIVCRSTQGEIITLPTIENIHINGILHQSIMPARIDIILEKETQRIAKELMLSLNWMGTLTIEMFIAGTTIYINELAPRPHNSGHLSIEAVSYSQFEQHVRCICGLPLGNSELIVPAATMLNILGQHTEKVKKLIAQEHLPNSYLHLYGKREEKFNRKMGHLTLLGNHLNSLLERVNIIWGKIK